MRQLGQLPAANTAGRGYHATRKRRRLEECHEKLAASRQERAVGCRNKKGPELKSRPTEGRREAVVEGFSRFNAAGGAVGLPRERSDARESEGAQRRRRRVRERSCGD
eukprot:5262857-Pleurochrysis_carterae.AAC.1